MNEPKTIPPAVSEYFRAILAKRNEAFIERMRDARRKENLARFEASKAGRAFSV